MDMSTITPAPEALRALSHPMRLRLLELLRLDGPSTASALAQRLGLNSGATSYHLRQLAQHGFVEDDPDNGGGRGTGRERWWRSAYQSTRTDDDTETSQAGREASDAFGQAIAVVHTEQLQRSVEERSLLTPEWRAASVLSDWVVRLTPGRARQLVEVIQQAITEWDEDEEDDPEAVPFYVHLHGFPRPGSTGR
jgi:predicted ArsR family transcriptional regulator